MQLRTADPTKTSPNSLPAGLFIGGQWIHDSTGGEMQHVNPATGTVQATFPVAGAEEVRAAIAAARAGLGEFRRWSGPERRDLLRRLATLLREDSEEFSRISTLETGVPAVMNAQIANLAADWFDYYAGWADKLDGHVVDAASGFDYSLYEPYGVVAIILTWNGPTGSIGMKVAAALAAGCAVVLKPPELAPFSSTKFAELCERAGLPAGVLNVVPGGPEAGDALVRHPDVDKISFTGGPATAARIQAACATSLTPLVLELGGKAANLVFDDADLERASVTTASGIIGRSGQVCVAPTRLLVQDTVYDEVVGRVGELLRQARIGDPRDPDTTMGPVISSGACERIMSVIERARADGEGTLVVGGGRVGGDLADGYFIEPTVFGDVDNASQLAQEEVFGPVLAASRFTTEEEAVGLANDSKYGLAAYVQTSGLARAHRIARQLDVGNVAINGGRPVAGPYAPFGGFKDSGYGKEGGWPGVMEYLRVKNVNVSFD